MGKPLDRGETLADFQLFRFVALAHLANILNPPCQNHYVKIDS
jgi:hypothetical protein